MAVARSSQFMGLPRELAPTRHTHVTRRCASGGWPGASARQWCPLTAARARHSLRTASGSAELLLAP